MEPRSKGVPFTIMTETNLPIHHPSMMQLSDILNDEEIKILDKVNEITGNEFCEEKIIFTKRHLFVEIGGQYLSMILNFSARYDKLKWKISMDHIYIYSALDDWLDSILLREVFEKEKPIIFDNEKLKSNTNNYTKWNSLKT